MGVRLYNPTTGRFLSVDPQPGGSCNTYDYTCANPTNATDLDGKRCWRCIGRSAWNWTTHHKLDIALTVLSFAPGIGQAAWAYRAYRGYRTYRTYRAARTIRYAARACRNSFTADTQVVMADGTNRDIDEVQIGDLVLAADPDTGEVTAEPVTDLIIGSGEKDLVTITADPDRDGHPGQLVATTNHPFYSGDRWKNAGDLTAADRLTTDTWTTYPVGTAVQQPRRHTTVYNLTVADLHTYYVLIDNTATLVHNCARAANWTASSKTLRRRRAAEAAARRMAGRTSGACRGRGNCNHYHCDFHNGRGEVTHTVHFRWRRWF